MSVIRSGVLSCCDVICEKSPVSKSAEYSGAAVGGGGEQAAVEALACACGELFPAASRATTANVYVVPHARPVWLDDVRSTVAIFVAVAVDVVARDTDVVGRRVPRQRQTGLRDIRGGEAGRSATAASCPGRPSSRPSLSSSSSGYPRRRRRRRRACSSCCT